MCEILVFWFRDSVWWKAAMLSIIGAWLALLVSWSHTASHWKTPNSNPTSPCAVLTGFKSMHADRDCNLRWVAVKGSLRDNLISHSAQRKTVLRAGNKCLFNIFPIFMQRPGALPGVEQQNKCQWETQSNKYFSLFIVSCWAIFMS